MMSFISKKALFRRRNLIGSIGFCIVIFIGYYFYAIQNNNSILKHVKTLTVFTPENWSKGIPGIIGPTPGDYVLAVAWNEDSSKLAALTTRQVIVWETSNWKEFARFDVGVSGIVPQPLGFLTSTSVVVSTRHERNEALESRMSVLTAWDIETGKPIKIFKIVHDKMSRAANLPPFNVSISSDHKYILTATGILFDVDTGEDVHTWDAPDVTARIPQYGPAPKSLGLMHDLYFAGKFSPDDKLVALCSNTGMLRLFNADDFKLRNEVQTTDNKADCLDVSFSPDGLLLVTSRVAIQMANYIQKTKSPEKFEPDNGFLRIWRVADASLMNAIHNVILSTPLVVIDNLNGYVAAVNADGLKLWPIKFDGTPREFPMIISDGPHDGLSLSRQGWLAAVSSGNETIKIYQPIREK